MRPPAVLAASLSAITFISCTAWSCMSQLSILGPETSGLFVSLHSDVLSHAWCQACVELCLLGRDGPMLG